MSDIKPRGGKDDSHDAVRNKLKRYNFLLSRCNSVGTGYEKIKQEKEQWLKSLPLEEYKISDRAVCGKLYRFLLPHLRRGDAVVFFKRVIKITHAVIIQGKNNFNNIQIGIF